MALDPNIALQIGQPVQPLDPLKAYGSVLTLKNLIDQQQMNGLQMQQAQRAADKEMRLSDLARRSGGDEAAFLNGYREVDPLGAIDLGIKTRKAGFEQSKMEREAEKAKYEMLGKRIELVGQVLGSLPENPTYEQAVLASRFLNKEGVRHDENEIPKDPALLPAYIKRERMRALTNKEQFEQNRPKSTFGQLLADSEDWEQHTRNLMDNSPPNIDPSNQGTGGDLQAPKMIVQPPPNPFLPAIKMAQGRDPNKPFAFDERGQPVANKEYQDYTLRNSKAGATNVTVQPNAVPLGKAAETKVDEGLLDTSATLMRLNGIRKQYKPEWSEFSTQAGMKLNQLGEKYLGVKVAPAAQEKFKQYTQWRQKATNNLNLTIKSLTGAAMSDSEAERIKSTLPTADDSPSEFQAKMEGAEADTKMALARLTYIKRNRGMSIADIPLEAMPEVMRARDREIEGEVLRRYPNMDPAERNDLIKRQLAQEFGLIGK